MRLLLLLCLISTPALAQWISTQPNPVLIADQEWEEGVVSEPTVLVGTDGLYRMWYSGGWMDCAVGLATSIDGLTWTKYQQNPVFGRGVGGANRVCHSNVFFEKGIYYLYYENDSTYGRVYVATSTDGIDFSIRAGPIIDVPWWAKQTGNTFVWREGNIYIMVLDAQGHDWVWRAGPAYAASPLGPFTFRGITWPSQCEATYGGEWIVKIGDIYHAWYHCTPDGKVDLPTNIWHATAPNLNCSWHATDPNSCSWTKDRMPLIAHSGVGWTYDQVADASIVTLQDGTVLLYYAGMNNRKPSGAIGVAVLHQPLSE